MHTKEGWWWISVFVQWMPIMWAKGGGGGGRASAITRNLPALWLIKTTKERLQGPEGRDGGTALGKICAYLMPTVLLSTPTPPQLANVPIGGLDLPRALIRLQQQKRKQHHRQPTTENTPLSEG